MTDAIDRPAGPSRSLFPFVAAGILAVVAIVYWPVHEGWFIWDDKLLIHDNAWITGGGAWWSIVLHVMPDWPYFRPLGLALLVAETRGFGVEPGPMHLVSLALHLANTALVGALAWRLRAPDTSRAAALRWASLATLAYGLHPALIEPVSWIASQFDLLLGMLVLLGLYLNLVVRPAWLRTLLVTGCFFLAACTKETAIAFPVLLALQDWFQSGRGPEQGIAARGRLRALVRRQWMVYLCMFAAGLAYLALRHWARAHAAPYPIEPFFQWSRFQTVAYAYLAYWRMIAWPFAGLSPVHIVNEARFAGFEPGLLAIDAAAVLIALGGLLLACRGRVAGIAIVGVTATLFPVLHIVPISYEPSLYHERYALLAIAWVCAWLPAALGSIRLPEGSGPLAAKASIALAAGWLLFAAVTVRSAVPLWANDDRCWHWALRTNPDSVFMMNVVMNVDLADGSPARMLEAERLGTLLLSKGRGCPDCMLNVANLAVLKGDPSRAAEALQWANEAMQQAASPATHAQVIAYVQLNANVHLLRHDAAGAEAAFRDAITIDPLRPTSYFALAMVLAGEGKAEEARRVFEQGVAVAAPDVAAAARRKFEAALAAGARLQGAAGAPSPPPATTGEPTPPR